MSNDDQTERPLKQSIQALDEPERTVLLHLYDKPLDYAGAADKAKLSHGAVYKIVEENQELDEMVLDRYVQDLRAQVFIKAAGKKTGIKEDFKFNEAVAILKVLDPSYFASTDAAREKAKKEKRKSREKLLYTQTKEGKTDAMLDAALANAKKIGLKQDG